MRTARSVHAAVVLILVMALTAACGGKDSFYEVKTTVVSHANTQDITVFEPQGTGPFPIVLALHGINGKGSDLTELATRLARTGLVVFAPTYRSDLTTNEGLLQTVIDTECAYRYVRSIAADHGGDLAQPVTFVGWSMGATLALQGGLTEEIDPTGQVLPCVGEVPRADVIVAISGCHDDFDFPEGAVLDFYNPSTWGNKDAHVVLVHGDADTNCPPRHSKDAFAELQRRGYDAKLVMLPGADHFAPVFHEGINGGKGGMIAAPDSPAGKRTVEVILDAIASAKDRP